MSASSVCAAPSSSTSPQCALVPFSPALTSPANTTGLGACSSSSNPAAPLLVSKSTALETLPLPPSARELFARAEFVTVGDLDGLSPAELAEELGEGVSPAFAAKLMLMARTGGTGDRPSYSGPAAPIVSALALLEEQRSARRLITFARELDQLLGGGVPLKQITEFSGAPGVGKTQLGMQLALNAQLPEPFGGLAGRCVYIDTEGSFLAARCHQMAEGLVTHLRTHATDAVQRAAAWGLDPLIMLERIAVYRVHDAHEQLAVLRALLATPDPPGVPPLRCVVVDSIAFHLRHTELPYSKRTQLLGQMAQTLASLATRSTHAGGPLAAVCINQVTTRVNEALGGASSLVPALGETWAHCCHVQLTLQWRDGVRLATLYKGLPPGEAAYAVTSDGIRSCDAQGHPVRPPPALPAHSHPSGQMHRTSQPPPPTPLERPSAHPTHYTPHAPHLTADENFSAQHGLSPQLSAPSHQTPLGKRPATEPSASAMAPPPIRHASYTPSQPHGQSSSTSRPHPYAPP